MKFSIRILLFVVCFAFVGQFALAQSERRLFSGFNPSSLNSVDHRFLQTALAFEGYYAGLLDGDWGPISRKAMNRYSWATFYEPPQDWHMAALAFGLFQNMVDEGWEIFFDKSLSMSYLIPFDSLRIDEPSDYFTNFHHTNSSLAYSVGRLPTKNVQNVHDYVLNQHKQSTEPYTVRKKNFVISSSQKANGSTIYARSHYERDLWSTVIVAADKIDAGILGAVTSSISFGRSDPLDIQKGGKLADTIDAALALLDKEKEQKAIASSRNSNEEEKIRKPIEPESAAGTSGSGFYVTEQGHVLTNAHVVDGCKEILVDGEKAKLINSSIVFDLALLETFEPSENEFALFSIEPAKLNSDVTAIGYPLAGLLGGLNVTRGAVSSLKGLGGDGLQMQISAPVQSGNSGGPLVSSSGEVVGVVVSKLNARKVSDELGDVPQNVNFAIRGEIVKLFLAQSQISPKLGNSSEKLLPEEIARKASLFTTFVECNF